MGEEIFLKLNACFTAGYIMPQYCLDKGIKKPLFVSEKKYELFVWQIYLQFFYDKRMTAQFCFIDADKTQLESLIGNTMGRKITINKYSEMKLESFDKIIFLTKEEFDVNNKKVVRFADVEKFFIKQTYVDIPLLNFLQRYPKVTMILTNFPSIGRFKGGKEFNSQLWDANELARAIIDSKGKHIETPLDKFGYTNEQVHELILASTVKTNSDGTTSMLKENFPLLRIQNGKRSTAYQPEHFQNRIYFFGACHYYGVNAPFDKTIESYLQKMLNEKNLAYRVENESQHFVCRYQDIFYNLNKITPAPGDIIFFWISNMKSNNNVFPFCDISDVFDPPHDFKEIYCRRGHVNEIGYKLVAEKFFEFLTENNFFREVEFNYPLPPPRITDMAFHLGLNKVA